MGTKLSTTGEFVNTPTVNVRGEKGQFMVGTLSGHRTVDSKYKNEDGTVKKHHIFTFVIEDTDMKIERKDGDKYVEVRPNPGDDVAVFASTRLYNALSKAKEGSRLKITYLGLGKATKFGGRPHDYDVEVL